MAVLSSNVQVLCIVHTARHVLLMDGGPELPPHVVLHVLMVGVILVRVWWVQWGLEEGQSG